MLKLTNLDMTKEIVFNNQAYVLNEKDLGKADITLSTFQGNNQIGVQVTGRVMNTRDISIVGFVLADSEEQMLQRKRSLQKIASPFEDFYLVVGDYKIRVSANSSIEYSSNYYENNKFLSRFLLNGTCANPCFTKLNAITVPVAFWKEGFRFPLRMSAAKPVVMGYRQPSQIKMIENTGETDIGLKIKLTAKVNDIQNPYIMNLLTQEKLVLNCVMAEGETIEINTNYGEKAVIQNGNTDYFYKVDLDSDFLQLHIGENYLRYGADTFEDNLEIDIEYLPQYLEV